MTQFEWRMMGSGKIEIGDAEWHRGNALGDGNNCLIDTLRQALGNLPVSLAEVRRRLQDASVPISY